MTKKIIVKKFNKILLIPLLLIAVMTLGYKPVYAATSPSLSALTNFSVLGGASVTCTGATTLTGMVGVSPGTSITGFPSPCTTGGGIQNNNSSAIAAQAENLATYTALDQACDLSFGSVDLTVTDFAAVGGGVGSAPPGVYCSTGAFTLTGNLNLTGSGVHIFKTVSTLITSSGSSITGGSACNIWWRVGSQATLGTSTSFKGNIFGGPGAGTTAMNTGATLNGRILTQAAGTITLAGNTISGCVAGPGGGGGALIYPPLINVVKVSNPLVLPLGPGPVTYTYTVTNIGVVPMTNVKLVGDTCSPIVLASGDTNNDSKLDVNEVWKYTCTTTLLATHTNTVTAIGYANGLTARHIAQATVAVGIPLIPPLIHIVKVPDLLVLPAGGGRVTYRFTVTNPGVAPLSNVTVTDNKCTGLPGRVVGHPGDLNKNDLLETTEAWSFTCISNLKATTTNTAIATGSANGFTVTDIAFATVVVASPKLPKTGIAPDDNNISWNIVALVGGVVSLFSLYIVQRNKQFSS